MIKPKDNVLVSGSKELMERVAALKKQFKELQTLSRRSGDGDLQLPTGVAADMRIWQCIVARFARGDDRYTGNELAAIRRFAQWMVIVKRSLQKQPVAEVDWRD